MPKIAPGGSKMKRQESIFYIGDIVQWRRQDLSAFEVGVMLDKIESGYTGPFRIMDTVDISTKTEKCQRLTLANDSRDEGLLLNRIQMSSVWFENFAG
jgi:hypothetical protein